ncbi:TIGR02391 family protein [Anaerobacillus sp. CMMVII]|uniref:TIGR02391 family protein n=1 Tax=Anaerobacillus sp. CMMVII TaxID=2755588 RepID=UPI0021B7FC28|nr:TIGR02391 family protein [Anaerobacillus sp. CMMVII]MCT8138602.1 TIGR02391 family protein [Anaerobacillus sp. CMMVII]
MKQKVNFQLRFYGFELNDAGKVVTTTETNTFSEALERSQSLIEKLEPYNIHPTVIEYCKPELLQKNYFHAIHEASKSTLSRIRQMNHSTADGAKLIEKTFSTKTPSLIINGNILQSDSEKNEYNALKHLLLTINFSYRNSTSHQVKIYNPKSELDATTALILISKAHHLLDKCECVMFID